MKEYNNLLINNNYYYTVSIAYKQKFQFNEQL